MWRLEYSEAAIGYLANALSDAPFLLQAVAEIARSSAGVPPSGVTQRSEPDLVFWEALGHLIVYQRLERDQVMRVLVIKPLA
ncbi:MAG: hypothetical protein KDJ52_23405 [Anaerolineae bacterium]|nr:hypothetical protein [Anaerolineae bacterium]